MKKRYFSSSERTWRMKNKYTGHHVFDYRSFCCYLWLSCFSEKILFHGLSSTQIEATLRGQRWLSKSKALLGHSFKKIFAHDIGKVCISQTSRVPNLFNNHKPITFGDLQNSNVKLAKLVSDKSIYNSSKQICFLDDFR